MLSSLMVTNLNLLDGYVMVPKSLPQKIPIKSAIMLPKPRSSPTTLIRFVFFPRFILSVKRTLPPLMMSHSPLWNRPIPCLKKQLLSWTVAMMITRYFSSWIPRNRTMSYALLPNVSYSTIINELLQLRCVTAGKEK